MANTQIIDRGWNAIRRELERASTLEVAVGILEGSKNGDGLSIAEYAAVNEYGNDRTPSRPFMRTAFDENVAKITQDMQRQFVAVTSGQSTARQALTVVGMRHAQRTQKTITGRDFLPKLAQSTIEAKKGSTKTLVDTGAMVNAVTIAVRGRTR